MGGCYTQLYSPFEKAAQLYTHKNESENLTNQQHETLKKRGGAWAGCGPAQSPPRCTKCTGISPPINGQCTNIVLFDVAL